MGDDTTAKPLRRKRRGRVGLWMLASVTFVAAFVILAALSLTGRPLVAPNWVTAQVEQRLAAGLGQSELSIRRVELLVDAQGIPRVILRNVEFSDPTGAPLAQLNEVGARFSVSRLLRGDIAPSVLRVSGGQVTVRRNLEGQFTLALGGGATAATDLAQIMAQVDAVFARPEMAAIEQIIAQDLTIALEDARSGRIWSATGGRMNVSHSESNLSVNVFAEVFNGTEDLAQMQFSVQSAKGSGAMSFGATIEGAAAQDIALQAPVLSYLGVLDAPISGALRAQISEDGGLDQFAATLELGAGALQPTAGSRPIAFNEGQVYLTFDPVQQRIDFSQIYVESDELRLVADGHAYLRGFVGPWPSELLTQLSFTEIEVAPEGIFAEALAFDSAQADFALNLQPFEVRIGQVSISDGPRRFLADGRVSADSEGWSVGLDLEVDAMPTARLLQVWPVVVAPKGRDWVSENVRGGQVSNVNGSLRLPPGGKPNFGLTYDFDELEVEFMGTLPAAREASGSSAVTDKTFSLRLDHGFVPAQEGGRVDISGTTFLIPDIHKTPSDGDIRLKTDGSLTAHLSILGNAPFRVQDRTGRPAGLADARAQLEARIQTVLRRNAPMDQVGFNGRGRLTGIRSDVLVPGRDVTSDMLNIGLTNEALTLDGAVRLDGLPMTIAWTQSFVSGQGATSVLSGEIELSERFADTFGISLPDGVLAGQGVGQIALDVSRDAPTTFELTSDLRGVALDVPSLNWQKPANAEGRLVVTGRFGETPEIDTLSLETPGLSAQGTVLLDKDGGFVSADLERLEVGSWLDAAVRVQDNPGSDTPTIRVEGGALDIRNLDLASNGAGVGGGPISLSLDRAIITDTISLAPFEAQIDTRGGLSGSFRARVNGGAEITGTLIPTENGTAMRLFSETAGSVARDAGLIRSLSGGALDLILRPRASGGYDGQVRITDVRLRNQPAIAGLLDAISIVGILDQLEGPGIAFQEMDGRFVLTSDELRLIQGAAVGPSIGISLDGIYNIGAEILDMQGVISPIYLLNGVGQIFTRPGEGLFGFSFTMSGPSDDPRVAVNPLSIFTPGMFREIFRRSPPSAQD